MGLLGKTERVRLTVGGMTCGNCVAHVKAALEGVPGVKKAHVDLEAGTASVEAKAGCDRQAMITAVIDAGYEAQ